MDFDDEREQLMKRLKSNSYLIVAPCPERRPQSFGNPDGGGWWVDP
jgi:hypothetical protein